MSNILLLNQKVKMAINEMDSNVNVGYPAPILDILTNKGITAWFQHMVEQLESTQSIIDKLGTLVVRTPLTINTNASGLQNPLSPHTDFGNGVYEFRFRDLDYPYFRYMSAYVTMTKDDCPAVRGKIRLEQHDDLNTVLIDTNRKPSWRYREVVGVITRDSNSYTDLTANEVNTSLTIYTDNCTVNTLHLTYLKIPNIVSMGGYNDINGNPSLRVECDISPMYYDEIVKFVMEEARQTYGFTNNKQ